MNNLIEKIKQWGIDRNLIGRGGKATPMGQSEKMLEEALELRQAAIELSILRKAYEELDGSSQVKLAGDVLMKMRSDALNEVLDGVGDVFVTLVLLCEVMDIDLEKCIEYAYNEIKDRKGRTENGVFIKEV